MKKLLLSVFSIISAFGMNAQTIYDNGPLVNNPGMGFNGADASSLQTVGGVTLSTYGVGHAVSSGFRVADNFTVPANTTWNIDSLVFFAYQTQPSAPFTNVSSITEVNVRIWDGIPGNGISTVVFGDSTTNLVAVSNWSGIYRTSSTDLTNEQRAIMRTTCETGGWSLSPGTYWVDWQTGGSLTSGPWAPPVTIAGQTTTGDARQYSPTTTDWVNIVGDATNNNGQGMPFLVVGTVISGVNETAAASKVNVFPNPVTDVATFRIDRNTLAQYNGTLSLKVYDAIGNIVKEVKNIHNNDIKINMTGLRTGFYMYELKSETRNLSRGKFVVN